MKKPLRQHAAQLSLLLACAAPALFAQAPATELGAMPSEAQFPKVEFVFVSLDADPASVEAQRAVAPVHEAARWEYDADLRFFDGEVEPCINGRTGDYLVIDSSQTGTAGNEVISLYLVGLNPSGPSAVVKKTFSIGVGSNHVTSGRISTDLSGETNFKIHYDDTRNILFLVSPATGKVAAMMLPEYL